MKKSRVLFAFVFVCLTSTFLNAAPASAVSVRKDALGVTLTGDDRVTRVEIWSDHVVRVRHSLRGSSPPAASLAVIAKPKPVKWNFSEEAGEVEIDMPKLHIRVDKATGAICFLDEKATPILNEAANGTALTPATVGSAKETLAVRQGFELAPDEAIFGLGQYPNGVMNYAGTSVRLLQENTKVAVPVLLSSKGYCVLWDNPAVTDVDVGKTDKTKLTWASEAGAGVDYYFLNGPEPDQSIAAYRWLTGAAPMFGKWAWGYWQCRERYKSQQELLDVVAEYRKRQIPIDGIIQDWQYWAPLNQETADAGWGSHMFDKSRYPDPAAMVKAIHAQNVHLMITVWPKFDVTDKGVSILNLRHLEAVNGVLSDSIPYVYPKGQGKWYDPFSTRARGVFWRDVSKNLFHIGVDAWWLDASEAELSGKWGEFRDFTTARGSGALVYNAFPLEHTRTVYEGQRAESSAKRVFILTRSAYAGQQRNAAVTWSGDIKGTWEVLQKQIPAGLNFCASGIPYWNTDIGGFFGGDPADPKYAELYTRWFQFGSFCPMFRVHGTNQPKEIWRFGDATQKILIACDQLRYHLLPYIYSVSWMVTHDGYTMMRPLVMDFRADANVFNITDQFMSGPALMACPVVHAGDKNRSVYFPEGTIWTDFWTGKNYDGGQKLETASPVEMMPLFVRAGSIIPYGPDVQYAMQKPDPIELRVYRGADGAFTLYEDEGDNYDYEKGVRATIPISWNETKGTLTIGARAGEFPGMLKSRTFRVVWVRPGHGVGIQNEKQADAVVNYAGKAVTVVAKD
jgi:alpha-D-xyloside xylohydrolase